MISSKEMKYEQDNPVPNGTVCTAIYDALPEFHIDLDFKKGEKIVIVEPCNVLFFYIGKNEEGKTGVIPINYFNFVKKEKVDNKAEDDRVKNAPQGVAGNQSPVATRRAPGSPRGSPLSSKPPVAARGSNTLPVGSNLSGFVREDSPPAAISRTGTSIDEYMDRRPPCPLPPEAAASPVSSMAATDNFKKTSGWFTPSAQQVWCIGMKASIKCI